MKGNVLSYENTGGKRSCKKSGTTESLWQMQSPSSNGLGKRGWWAVCQRENVKKKRPVDSETTEKEKGGKVREVQLPLPKPSKELSPEVIVQEKKGARGPAPCK